MKLILKYFNIHYRKLFKENVTNIEKIKSGISERMVYRLESDNYSCIAVTNNKPKENLAFIKFSEVFRNEGLNVPAILYVSSDRHRYLISDLGKTTLFEYQQRISPRDKLLKIYKKALRDLIMFQKIGRKKIDFNLCYETKVFDAGQVNFDFNKFCEFYLSGIAKVNISGKMRSAVLNILNDIVLSIPENQFMYRDFQPRNIIIDKNKLGYVDYQSGRIGPVHYDLASFLYSGSIDISPAERKELFLHYAAHAEKSGLISTVELKKRFYDVVFLRLLQVLGSYGYSNIVRKRKNVLQKIPKAIKNIKSIRNKIKHTELVQLAEMIINKC